jgi:cyclase
VLEWARELEGLGAGELVLNSIDTDGVREGYNIPLNESVAAAVKIPVIASGGAGTMEHFYDVLMAGANGALAASVFHFGVIGIRELKEYLEGRGVPVRRV